jgi:catechol-2,3-dioxygenase
MAVELNFVILSARDVAGMRDFYRNTLDLTVQDENPGFVQFQVPGGAIFALQGADNPRPAQTVELWWQAGEVDALHAALTECGVTIEAAPSDQPFGRAMTMRDPEGNAISFYQPRQG